MGVSLESWKVMDARPGPSADLTATPRADHSERYRPEPARGYTFPSGSRGSLKNCRWRLAANADADLNDPDWVRRSPRGSSVHYYALQHQRLCSVWRRHFEYFGLPSNLHRLTPSIRRRVAFGIARSIAEASSLGAPRAVARTLPLPTSSHHLSPTYGFLLT